MDSYQQFIHTSRYARWRPDLQRRENWLETVQRYIDFFDKKTENKYTDLLNGRVKQSILNLDVMPSMRALMAAGKALELENVTGYNCSYLACNTPRAFAESLYILMCGTGVGFSCEESEVAKLPQIPKDLVIGGDLVIQVEDSRIGWAEAYNTVINHLYSGVMPIIDYSLIRPAGAVLKTIGGRASGPEPFKKLIDFTMYTFRKAIGRKLKSVEVHDIMCMIGEVVVVGGVRRSALISLSDLADSDMRAAKIGEWWSTQPFRALANNSVAYTSRPDAETFLEEWTSLVKSKCGERGIFNREAAQNQAARWGRRSADLNYGCNPCSEIILRDKQFCNLSEVVVRHNDTLETLLDKVEIAAILGTLQATLSNFNFIGGQWVKNTTEEALLGVSLTGIMDCKLLNNLQDSHELKKILNKLRGHARVTNGKWARNFGINPSTAITCIKPSGTVSQLCDSASGIHARHNAHYIRTVRVDKQDPIYFFAKDSGLVIEDCQFRPYTTAVVSFPIKAPSGATTRNESTAIEMLELWLFYQREWCEHKPSVTITVKDHEWCDVGAWVYKNFNEISGISFLPHTEHTYVQAPYQDLTKEEYEQWLANHPQAVLDWSNLAKYESDDYTTGAQTLSCFGGNCDI